MFSVLSHCSNDFQGFSQQSATVIDEIVGTGYDLGFNKVDSTNVLELLHSHHE